MLDPLPCRDGSTWSPDWRYEAFLRSRFTNLGTEWQKMLLWLMSNPNRQKTVRGMKRFVGNWMAGSGIIRREVINPARALPPQDRESGRIWLKSIRAQLHGRQPGED